MKDNFEKRFNFGPACEDEAFVYGAETSYGNVIQWIAYMHHKGIERICCLQQDHEIGKWIIDSYCREFGKNNVKHNPIKDNHLCSFDVLKGDIIPFLQESYEKKKKVVVHCLGGNGRTGHVLAAWLAYKYRLDPKKAIAAIKQMGRDPTAAVIAYRNATMEELINLLAKCRDLSTNRSDF